MQIKKKRSAITITPVNRLGVVNAGGKKLQDTPYFHLLLCLAEIADSNGKGSNAYATLGCVKDFTSLTLSCTIDGDRDTLYDNTLAGLSEQSAAWHDDV